MVAELVSDRSAPASTPLSVFAMATKREAPQSPAIENLEKQLFGDALPSAGAAASAAPPEPGTAGTSPPNVVPPPTKKRAEPRPEHFDIAARTPERSGTPPSGSPEELRAFVVGAVRDLNARVVVYEQRADDMKGDIAKHHDAFEEQLTMIRERPTGADI